MTAAAPAQPTAAPPRLSTYSAVAIGFHWLIAALMLTNIGLAWYFGTLKGPAEVAPLGLHKSIGITVLLLTLLRIGWRFTSRPPPLPPMKTWQRWTAKVTHFLFYVLMLGMPLSGWAMVSASPLIKVHPTVLYGVIPWPAFPYPHLDSDTLHDVRHLMGTTHGTLAWLAYAMIVLHVAAALKHQLIDHDDVLARMIPPFQRKGAA
ncbi:MAG TPA: cytochrome b [Caulobacteraceae bacterium]|jgi:cytochrome b561|nr:cytochrome b [Caulobacteraceae bacterium]